MLLFWKDTHILKSFTVIKVKYSFKNKISVIMVLFMNEPDVSISAMHRICLKSGAKRVSDAATKELALTLEKIGLKIAKDALDYAMHSGRKTIKADDIELAAKKIMTNGTTL